MNKQESFNDIPRICLVILLVSLAIACAGPEDQGQTIIVPAQGYDWPSQVRDYWPTQGWRTASMEAHGIDPARMALADDFARDDYYTRALLVVKDGYVVFEKYYGDGAADKSSNLWSVTKSVTSALAGIAMDKGRIAAVDDLMTAYLPEYPAFADIRIRHVLTQTTGLRWFEQGIEWVNWIFSEDWIAHALGRGRMHEPGETFFYSSGNSHFLSALVRAATGQTLGEFAAEHLFAPLGIRFDRQTEPIVYNGWDEYKQPFPHSWRQDPMGNEIGGFALYLTAREMAKIGFLFLNRGIWEGQSLLSASWIEESVRDHMTDIYGRYSYGYQWWITLLEGEPGFLASGLGGQIIGVVPSLDLVVVIKYEAENPVDPSPGTGHDDMYLFELVVRAAQ